ncbi:ABC transporter ATP-binding protein [bacterium]|nr:MAG: ABC transporter ATP-binding protein [bacterium]
MNNIIKISGLRKVYKDGAKELEVLKGIDLEIKKKEFLVVQGPSGAGKSTLLHILGGLDNPTEGSVHFENKNIYSLSETERAKFRNRKIGFVFQFFHLLPELSALENVLLPALLKSWWERKKSLIYAKHLLETLGLSDRITHKPKQLSGGEQQRVAMARSLVNKPELLLCDEPTGNLDSENGKKIIELIKKINHDSGMSIVLVTHDKEIAGSAGRVVHLKDGLMIN